MYLGEDGNPYYIGKGLKYRAWKHSKNELVPSPNDQYIKIYKDDLSNREALDLEIEFIDKFGRLDEGTGILHNKTPGGDNPPSQKGRVVPDERRKRISESLKGRPSPKKGITLSREHREKIKKNHKGWTDKQRSDETKLKISQTKKGTMTKENHPSAISVNTPHGIFPTLTEAAKHIGVSFNTIANRCRSDKFLDYSFQAPQRNT